MNTNTRKKTHRNRDDEHHIVQDGESVVVPLFLMDSAQRAIHDIAPADDNGQAAYEARICDAWKDDADTVADGNDNGQAAYLRRITEAWQPDAAA